MAKKEIFSEEALSRLRSPEQLDSLLIVTQPVAWMALVTVCFMVASIVLWSFYGVMSVTVESAGMIIDSGGLVNVRHDSSGRVSELMVRPGKRVKRGDVVANILQLSTENDINTAQQEIRSATSRSDIESGITRLDSLSSQLNQSRSITSEYDGIVTEVAVNVGDIVSAGSTIICSIRQDQGREDMLALMYVPIDSGKSVTPGMFARLTPSGVDTNESGNLIGIVREVSLYPSSSGGIAKDLGNSEVVNWILTKLGGAAMEVKVDLVRDPESESGYLWSSVVGKHPRITVGSACTGSIVVDRRPPISKVFLKLSQWLRAY
jgi:biotin carboxyl carrier protein